jgi:pseudouridine kinase
MGGRGSVYANNLGESGICLAKKVHVNDTTGAGDAFCSGVAIGLTYGKTLAEAVKIGTTLASSVIVSNENVCPRFLPQEFGIDVKVED